MNFDGILITKNRLKDYIAQQHIMRYIFAGQYVKEKVVLDVACGSGYGSNYLARKGAKKVFGTDIDKVPLEIARKNYSTPNLEFVQGSVLELPFPDNFFDVVVSFETIEHLTETKKYIKEIKRVLKKGGTFICSTPNIKYTEHPEYHVREFYPSEFFSLIEKNFGNVKKYAQYITRKQRILDVLKPKQRLFFIGTKVLNNLPKGKDFKMKIKKLLGYNKSSSRTKIKPLIIDERLASFMKDNKVVPLGSRKRLLRIMITVAKNTKK